MSAYWTADRSRGKILQAPRRAYLQALTAACSAATFAALSSRRLRGVRRKSTLKSFTLGVCLTLYRPRTQRRRGLNNATRHRKSNLQSEEAYDSARSLSFFNRLASHFCNLKGFSGIYTLTSIPAPCGPASSSSRGCGSPFCSRYRCRTPCSGRGHCRPMSMVDPPSRISERTLWTVKIAPLKLTPKTRSNAFSVARKHRAIAARPGSASSRRLVGLGRLRLRPFGAAGGRRRVGRRVAAGKDSSSSSSSFSSGFSCDLLGADFRGSFIPASPCSPCYYRPRTPAASEVPGPGSVALT